MISSPSLLRKICLLPLLVLVFSTVAQAQFNFTTNSGKLTITGYTGTNPVVIIPSTTNGLPVTAIGNSAFFDLTTLTSVSLSDNVTSIGASSFFHCTSLASFTIPKNVISIGPSAFTQCSSLTAIAVDPLNSAYTSGGGVLLNKSQTRLIKCPEGKSGSYTIPDSVTNIDANGLDFCTSLTAIEVDALSSVYSSLEGVLLDKSLTTIIKCPGGKSGNYIVPNGVTNIVSGAFSLCTSLTNITIPQSVLSIGSSALANCTSLSAIEVDAQNPIYSSVDGVLFNKTQTTLSQCPGGKAGSYAIPDGVTNVGNSGFSFCKRLTNIVIPDSVTSISSLAFDQCSVLTSVILGNSVTNIGGQTFQYCTSLRELYFKANAPSLGSFVLYGDTNATVFYLSGTTGWGPTFGGRPTAIWQPKALVNDAGFGVRTNQFGFNIDWASGMTVVVEASENLTNPVWSPLQTNTLTGNSLYFSDPDWMNHPARLYRIRSP